MPSLLGLENSGESHSGFEARLRIYFTLSSKIPTSTYLELRILLSTGTYGITGVPQHMQIADSQLQAAELRDVAPFDATLWRKPATHQRQNLPDAGRVAAQLNAER
jgi:hypothetical protein